MSQALSLGAEARAALRSRSRARALDHFGLDNMRLETLDVYDGLLGTQLKAGYR